LLDERYIQHQVLVRNTVLFAFIHQAVIKDLEYYE